MIVAMIFTKHFLHFVPPEIWTIVVKKNKKKKKKKKSSITYPTISNSVLHPTALFLSWNREESEGVLMSSDNHNHNHLGEDESLSITYIELDADQELQKLVTWYKS